MNVQLLAVPNKRLTLSKVALSTTPAELLAKLDADYPELLIGPLNRVIITNRSNTLKSIAANDVVNRWYNGQMGDIYRILDDSSTNYRKVVGERELRPKSKPGEIRSKIYGPLTSVSLYHAHRHSLRMLSYRLGYEPGTAEPGVTDRTIDLVAELAPYRKDQAQILEIQKTGKFDQLNVLHLPMRRGKVAYVYWNVTDSAALLAKKRTKPFIAVVNSLLTRAATDYNRMASDQPSLVVPKITAEGTDDDAAMRQFMERIELIVIVNNDDNGSYLPKVDLPLQIFTVQELSYDPIAHVDQPSWYLLDPNNKKNRDEILAQLAMDGPILKADTPISEQVAENTPLLII
jgi:hypothetical protein